MDWKDKKIVMLGAARQGTALASYLIRQGARVVLTDARPLEQLQEARQALDGLAVEWAAGGHSLSMLDGADLLCLSGGVPSDIDLVAEAHQRGIPISNDSQIFLEEAPCKVIGITGSAGKTTTTMLVGRMLKAMEGKGVRRIWVGGNIGNPLVADLPQMHADDLAVMELSSFQLEWITRAPHIAAILNLAPNHLDRHETMENYVGAKARILDFQTADDVAVLNREDSRSWSLVDRVQGHLLLFGRDELAVGQFGTYVRDGQIWRRDENGETSILPLSAIGLRGDHNLMNVLAACAIAAAAGATPAAMLAGVRGFRGAPHRLEFVRMVNGVDWYNDSIATAPQRAEAAIRSFEQPLVLLFGGRDKGLVWEDLAKLAAQRAHQVVLFGEAAGMLQPIFAQAAPDLPISRAANLAEAVQQAASTAKPGDVVLLAPGGTSFDEFKDFEARGERFRQLVNEL